MKVSLRTYGGLMGGLGQPAHVIDDADLDDSDKAELRRLVAAAAASPAHPQPTEQLRDAQTYEIEIDDHGKLVTLEATDGGVPQAFAELREWLRDH
ncbi:MAG TPA: protealysin inhibitor emfourin [Mycobacterium sp.]|jgi:hypothetical protein|nr:protealysin inhibitor emfourin [Mycobacterium sp.]